MKVEGSVGNAISRQLLRNRRKLFGPIEFDLKVRVQATPSLVHFVIPPNLLLNSLPDRIAFTNSLINHSNSYHLVYNTTFDSR